MKDNKEMKHDFVPKTSQRTVLPPTKYMTNSESNKVPLLVPDVKIFQEEQNKRLSSSKHANQLEQRLVQTLSGNAGDLSSDASLDKRMVLPTASLVSNCQSRRTVVLPQGKSKSQQPTETVMQPSHSSLSSSKIATARQAYVEELEFLKLKLRYMQNAIELKQNQIDSEKISQSKSCTISIKGNTSSHNYPVKASPDHNARIVSASNSHLLLQNKLHTGSSATKWTAPTAIQQKTSTDLFDKRSYLQGKHKSFHVSTETKKSHVVTKGSTGPTVYSWSSYCAPKTSSDTLRPNSSSGNGKVVYTKQERTVPDHVIPFISNISSPVLTHQLYFAQNKIKSTQTEGIIYPSSVHSMDTNVVSDESKMEVPVSKILTTNKSKSAFERLGNYGNTEPTKLINISPDKRLVMFSLKSVPDDPRFSDLQQTITNTVSFPTDVISSSVNNGLRESNLTIPDVSYVEHIPNSPNINTYKNVQNSHPLGEAGSISVSTYKLVKNTSCLPTGITKAPTISSTLSSLSSHIDSNIDSNSFPLAMKAAISLRRASQTSRLSLKTPNLKIQTAAKLVSKYKIKKLSPTSSSQSAPIFFYNKAQYKKSSYQHQQENCTTFRHNSKNLHKLDRRQINNCPSTPKSSLKKVTGIYGTSFGVLTKKNLESGHISKQQPSTSRYHQQILSTNDQKIGRELYSHGSPNLHSLDRSLKWESNLKVNPKQAGLNKDVNNRWTQNGLMTHLAMRDSVRVKRSTSKYDLKVARMLQSGTSHRADLQNSRFKWSRPNVQVQNGAWQQLRQKLQLMLNRKYRHSRFTFSRNPSLSAASVTKTSKIGDYKSNLVTIDGITYRSSKRKLTRTRRLSGSSSTKMSVAVQRSKSISALKSVSRQKMKLISVEGVHFHVDHSGKRLCRTSSAGALSAPASARRSSSSHASRAVHRSIAISAAKYRKTNHKSKTETLHCIYFGRFGKCKRGDKCPFIHNPDKVAICTRFLRGKCDTKICPFSHKASVNKMPVCLFYLRGSCCRENCPYIHVRVNPNAPICKDFRNGYCSLGEKCKKIHSYVCPSFAMTGACSRAEICTMLHRVNKRELVGLSLQAKSLSQNARENSHVDMKMCVPQASRESNTFKPIKSIFRPSAVTLTTQPSFISLENTPSFISLESTTPSFISLEKRQSKVNENTADVSCQNQPRLSANKEVITVLDVTQQNSTKDVIQSIRPSFLSKKLIENKTAQETETSQQLPHL